MRRRAFDIIKLMHYVYVLKSVNFEQTYVDYSSDLKTRLHDHNSGKSPHTKKYKPWRVITYLAFESEQHARDFEKYLKTGSGRAFIKRHLL